ncbi:MAG: Gfo/Idh/MocA family oxidoreductase [Armatimonadota bacterium]|nr:Gfo/Idh/MocA family oxidoreductase [Armatimonadota bacterium]MDR7486677.1 Gfo/Idh/MocA family oxidoreductase [Armatimonadota bacterium]MDR7533723.1 Gfo/Idh/MocA family oxidoreductase [Armatimonadota bacterium]MDR7535070.1 Gfo/Idh/MocA family oxidoreductase [Armatimonadota bacterium]
MVQIGVIGAGRYGRFLIETLRGVEGAAVTAVVGSVEATARATAEQYGIPMWTADYRQMLEAAPVDLVVVASPPYLHVEMAEAALAAGRHVLLEKPPALSLADLERLQALADRAGRVVAVDYHMRFNPLYRAVHRLRTAGVLGALTRVAVDNLASDEPLAPSHWFWDPARSGGVFVEHGVHFFDILEQVLGHPAVLLARTYRRDGGPADRAYCAVEYPDGILATFWHAFDRPYQIERTTVRLVFDRGVVELHGWVPLRLAGHALLEEEEIPALAAAVGADAVRAVEQYDRNLMGKGRTLFRPWLVEIARVLPGTKEETFRRAVADLVADVLAAVAAGRAPLTALATTAGSLRTALACAELAGQPASAQRSS